MKFVFSPNKRSFRGPGGVGRELESVGGLKSVARRCPPLPLALPLALPPVAPGPRKRRWTKGGHLESERARLRVLGRCGGCSTANGSGQVKTVARLGRNGQE